MGTTNYHRKIIQVLERLHKAHPTYNLGKHLSTALDGQNVWALTDKELLTCLRDYKTELEIDIPHKENDVEDIIKQGMNLNSFDLLEED